MTFDEKEPPSSADLFTADIPPTEYSVLFLLVSKTHTVYSMLEGRHWHESNYDFLSQGTGTGKPLGKYYFLERFLERNIRDLLISVHFIDRPAQSKPQ